MGKMYSEAELGYFAGMLDADGAIMALIEKHQEKKFKHRIRIVLKISQKANESLLWFPKTFNVGAIRRNRSAFDWLVRRQNDVTKLLILVSPYVQVKRKQVSLALDILGKNQSFKKAFLQAAQFADTLSKLNVRSTNRRKNNATMIYEYFSRND